MDDDDDDDDEWLLRTQCRSLSQHSAQLMTHDIRKVKLSP
jgi:hypothetical protein